MNVARFLISHAESESEVVIDFALKNGKIQKTRMVFTSGNVIDLHTYAYAKALAIDVLTDTIPTFFPRAESVY